MDLKSIIAANIAELRRAANMTQFDLAEKLNYTDKAVSKWERGDSVPDITVLKQIADLFGVKVDDLLTESAGEILPAPKKDIHRQTHGFIIGLAVLLVWMIATVAFVASKLALPAANQMWIAFVIAVPVSFTVWLVLNSIWFDHRKNYLIISLLMWSVLAAIHLSLLTFIIWDYMWLIYILGIPGQAIILLWSNMHRCRK